MTQREREAPRAAACDGKRNNLVLNKMLSLPEHSGSQSNLLENK
jgi:hypothetical protein